MPDRRNMRKELIPHWDNDVRGMDETICPTNGEIALSAQFGNELRVVPELLFRAEFLKASDPEASKGFSSATNFFLRVNLPCKGGERAAGRGSVVERPSAFPLPC